MAQIAVAKENNHFMVVYVVLPQFHTPATLNKHDWFGGLDNP